MTHILDRGWLAGTISIHERFGHKWSRSDTSSYNTRWDWYVLHQNGVSIFVQDKSRANDHKRYVWWLQIVSSHACGRSLSFCLKFKIILNAFSRKFRFYAEILHSTSQALSGCQQFEVGRRTMPKNLVGQEDRSIESFNLGSDFIHSVQNWNRVQHNPFWADNSE